MTTRHPGLTRALGRTTFIAAAAALALAATSSYAVPYPTRAMPAAQDLGAATDGNITVTVLLKSRDEAGMDRLVKEIYTPGSRQFHRFLSAREFHRRFDPSPAAVAKATAFFVRQGLAVRQKGNLLEVTGPARAHEAAFGVKIHKFEVPSFGRNAAFRFHAAKGDATIADASVASLVDAVVGLDNEPHYRPNIRRPSANLQRQAPAASQAGTTATTNPPGHWTVNDLASYYNVTPLYDAGYHGEGQTVGIVTLASFTPSDAFQYWSENGLTVDPNRLTVVDVDGGPGPVSDSGGSGETTLDVEQAGGLAPAANVVVYQAPNTDVAFLDAFAQAVNDDVADSISVSWGAFEWFDTQSGPGGAYGNRTYMKAFDKVFLQAAIQGQTLIAAQGDAGAYEANRALPLPQFAPVLSVGAPASSPWITSAGGTTLPGTQVYTVNGQPFPVDIPTEQAWGWSYLTGLCNALGYDPVSCGIFPSGGGGGVSAYHAIPFYQKHVAGMRVTEAGQSVIDESTTPPTDYLDLPAGFAGRNVPDVSLNADPETGYVVDYTSETGTYSQTPYYGGTSFVAPQLNGLAAIISQRVGGRIGLLNVPLYAMARHGWSYTGRKHPFNDITAGDNWGYGAVPGYDQASGVGTLNVANFARKLARSMDDERFER